MFFKGYVETKGKKSVETFKNKKAEDFKTYEDVKNLNSFAGVLGDNTILIDIDDTEQSEKLLEIVKSKNLKCRVYQTTRGMHFLFKNSRLINTNKIKTKLAIDIIADIKIGSKNSYEVLKIDGVEREILYDNAENENAETLPKWLSPIKTNLEFYNKKDGDGRNQLLFGYILVLQKNQFSKNEIKETLKIINEFIFKDPLSKEELDTILRKESFKDYDFISGDHFSFNEFGDFLKEKYNMININNQLHFYEDDIYKSGDENIEKLMIKNISNLKQSQRSEVLAYLKITKGKEVKLSKASLICFKNGIYDVYEDELLEHSPEYIITNKINWNYNEDAYSEILDKALDDFSCNNREVRMLLEEVVGYTLFARNELGKAFILVGEGSNGKSTFLSMIRKMLGSSNYSSLDLSRLNDRFSMIRLFGKLANLGDDISDDYIPDTSDFKKIVTGEPIEAEEKGKPKFDFFPYVKLVFSANSVPRMGKSKSSEALLRRLVIIPFNAKFSKESLGDNFDPYYLDKLTTEESIEYLIRVGIEGLKRVLKNKKFTNPIEVQKELDNFKIANNPILEFFKDLTEDDLINEPTSIVYKRYNVFCIENNIQPISNIEFSRQIKKHFNVDIKLIRIQGSKGSRHRIFIKKENPIINATI